MLVIDTVLPVFGLILTGWVLGRLAWLPDAAVETLNAFVVRLALPVVMAQFLAEADWRTLWHPGFVAAMGGGMALIFAGTVLVAARRRPLGEASLQALSATHANTAFMGIPIGRALFGDVGVAAAVIASLLTLCLLFAIAVMLVEFETHRDKGLGRAAAGVLRGLARNPMIVGPAIGALWAAGGLTMPVPLHTMLGMISATASPVALITIGLFVAARAPVAQGGAIVPIVALKLIGQPLVTWGLCRLLAVPHPWDVMAVLIAALPTGTGPFSVARLYDRDAGAIARVVLIGTMLSAFTVAALVYWIA